MIAFFPNIEIAPKGQAFTHKVQPVHFSIITWIDIIKVPLI
jgi:hypothetical protein